MKKYFTLFFVDINECSLNSDGCDQVCTNTLGSFQCGCNRGYTLNADEITCSGMSGIHRITCTAQYIVCDSEDKYLSLQISMSVLLTMMVVIKSAITLLDRFSVTATEDTA